MKYIVFGSLVIAVLVWFYWCETWQVHHKIRRLFRSKEGERNG